MVFWAGCHHGIINHRIKLASNYKALKRITDRAITIVITATAVAVTSKGNKPLMTQRTHKQQTVDQLATPIECNVQLHAHMKHK